MLLCDQLVVALCFCLIGFNCVGSFHCLIAVEAMVVSAVSVPGSWFDRAEVVFIPAASLPSNLGKLASLPVLTNTLHFSIYLYQKVYLPTMVFICHVLMVYRTCVIRLTPLVCY